MSWQAPEELPDLRRAGRVALDLEARDEGLRAGRGSSWAWGDGHIAGVSVAWREGGDIRPLYAPMRHVDTNNFDPAQVHRWVKDLFASDATIITMNGIYDYGWLRSEAGILMPPSDRLEEIGALASIVDENQLSYGLDALCARYGLPGKDETLLRQAVEAAGFPVKRAKEYIWQLPARSVGPYAEIDAVRTLELSETLNPILDREGTRDAYRLNVDLLPMVLEMRRRGIRIDQSAAEQAREHLLRKRDAALAELSDQLGKPVSMAELNSPKWKVTTFDAHHIGYPRTDKGNPSFKAGKLGWMRAHKHWLPQGIGTASKYHAAGEMFLGQHILGHLHNGRIHAEIHPYRSDDGGARSSRFAYSAPPLQQMPARDKEIAPLIRDCFLPEADERWCKPDISQQEFRHVVDRAEHFNLPGAKEAGDAYRNDPDADFHIIVADITGLDRDMAKGTNFAKVFGAGVKKFAEMIGKPLSEAQLVYGQYDSRLPFVWQLARDVQAEANRLGYTVLYGGARRHWNLWEAAWVPYTKGATPCSYEEAMRRRLDPKHPWFYCTLQRAQVYTALNALIQGSAAQHTKLWMRAVWREGIVPLLQMHDCLDCSVTSREQGELVARLGCEAVQLSVPIKVDLKFGKSWGDATHSWDELEQEGPRMTAAETIAKALGGRRTASGWSACCPLHDDRNASLSIGMGNNGKVLVHCHAGCNQREVFIAVVRKRGLLGTSKRKDRPISENDGERSARALAIWRAAQPAAATLVETYLAARGITLPVPDALRFHRSLKHQTGDWWPAMVGLVTNGVDATPLAIHRTFLAHDGGGKAPVDPQKMMFGPCRGGVVRLASLSGDVLMIGEGIETCLSAMQATGHPTWAALSTAGLRSLELPADVRDVIVLADADPKGEAAARACAWRWQQEGRSVRIARPPQGMDFNDMLTAGAGQ